ncbi:hypothetical protein [Halomonas sp.]|uniref:hypothetical protein n=1 Tax=Halomonas sp. TaxID=1486246 RepID=UPI003A0FF390
MLTYAVQLHRRRGSLLIDDYKELEMVSPIYLIAIPLLAAFLLGLRRPCAVGVSLSPLPSGPAVDGRAVPRMGGFVTLGSSDRRGTDGGILPAAVDQSADGHAGSGA